MTDDETVRVPRSLLAELSRYLDREDEDLVEVPGNGFWSKSMVRKLREEVVRYEGATAVIDLAARRAGDPDPVSLDEVARVSGLSKKKISADLGAMSKAARRLFGEPRWPLRALDSAIGMTYLMPAVIADWWLADMGFWVEPTISELARTTSIAPIDNAGDLCADLWDSEDERDAFLEETYAARRAM